MADPLGDIVSFLREGRRLEVPVFAPPLVADLMVSCWEEEPGDRPTFSYLEEQLGSMLARDVRQLYLKIFENPLQVRYYNENQERNLGNVSEEADEPSCSRVVVHSS